MILRNVFVNVKQYTKKEECEEKILGEKLGSVLLTNCSSRPRVSPPLPSIWDSPWGPAVPQLVWPELRGWWSSPWLWSCQWLAGLGPTYQLWAHKQPVCRFLHLCWWPSQWPLRGVHGRVQGLSYRKCLAVRDTANSQEMLKISIILPKIFLMIFKRASDI